MELQSRKKKRTKTKATISNTGQRAIIIFIRVPELGKVKTRLAKEVGEEKALKIYKALLSHTREVSLNTNASRYLYYATSPVKDEWDEDQFIKSSQKGEGLGERMMSAFQEVLTQCQQVLIIGSDCPQLSSKIIEEAFEKLENSDVVIGPTMDGGYYLLGLKEMYPFLFENMEWSTENVNKETIKRSKENGLSIYELDILSDVDYKEDWDKYGWEI